MTVVTFQNPCFGPLYLGEDLTVDQYRPLDAGPLPPGGGDRMIGEALDRPVGAPDLAGMVSGKRNVLIVIDDNSRTTPADRILPILLNKLGEAGIGDGDIKILVGLGTHRPMSGEELEKKVGPEIYRRCPVCNHDWGNPGALSYIGKTRAGIDIWVNRMVAEADFVIGLGHIVPHRVAGYSGGGKIIQPGVCGPGTTGRTHWMSAYYSASEMLGRPDNPVRREIEEVAAMAGLKFIVNVVQDRTGRLAGVFAGDPVEAHRMGCRMAEKIYGVPVKERADIVISEAFPAESELWLATKALQAADVVVRPGGVIVLLAECPEGVSRSHGALISKLGFRLLEEVEGLVARQEITNLNVASYLARVGNIACRKRVILVSRGIAREQARRLGFDYAATPPEALEMALQASGKRPGVAVLHHGSEILPVLPEA